MKLAEKASQIKQNEVLVPALVLMILLVLFVIITVVTYKVPHITYITPQSTFPGDELSIYGDNFGTRMRGRSLYIGGVRPVNKNILLWSDKKIIIKVPRDIRSGLVHVKTARGTSNAVLYTNKEDVPVVVKGPSKTGHPYISAVVPPKATIGQLITIKGANLGRDGENAEVFFPWAGESPPANTPESVLIKLEKLDIKSWGPSQIELFVPCGISSGSIVIKTQKGKSNSVFFELSEEIGKRRIHSRHTYDVKYEIAVSALSAEQPNSLYIWVPWINEDTVQRQITYKDVKPEPFYKKAGNLILHKFYNLKQGQNITMSQYVIFDRYYLETEIQPENVPVSYNVTRNLYQIFTHSNSIIPSEKSVVRNLRKKILGPEKNPYGKARKIYDYMLDAYRFSERPAGRKINAYIKDSELNTYEFAVLYTALLRNAGIPSRPVAGFFVTIDKKTMKHYWNEFYIEQFGWLPVDIVLASGGRSIRRSSIINPRDFYFGSIDNQHITFSRGIISVPRMSQYGRAHEQHNGYSFQSHHEEVVGKLWSFVSDWKNIEITGIY